MKDDIRLSGEPPMRSVSRREFLKKGLIIGGAGLIGSSLLPRLVRADEPKPAKDTDKEAPVEKIIAVYSCTAGAKPNETDPEKLVKGVLEILGGMKKFVRKDDVVLVKPNIAWERKPELAATTNPDLVAAIVKETLAAGAKKVKVMDRTCNDARRCYRTTGIEEAAKKAGAEVILIEKGGPAFKKVEFPKGKMLKSWDILKEALECNVFINVPIAKHHGLTKLTLGIKNLMGIMNGNRGDLHTDIEQKLTDVLTVVKPHLTIMDAYRVLVTHGPTGGGEKDVRFVGKVIAGVDIVAVDSYTASLPVWSEKLTGEDINYIKLAAERDLGEIDLKKMKVIEKSL